MRFPPVPTAGGSLQHLHTMIAAPQTSVLIEIDGDYTVNLVASFAAAGGATSDPGELVAGAQQVSTQVYINCAQQLPLFWLAQVLRIGDIAANGAVFPYTADSDSFSLTIGTIALSHGAAGWTVPSFDSTLYAVFVGFGLGSPYAFPAFLTQASPLTTMKVDAGGYVLAQPTGTEQTGQPVVASESWTMPLGKAWLLRFDASGVGTLSLQ